MSPRVVVLGDVMLDVVVKPSEDIAPTSDTAAIIHVARGGSGANLAVAVASQGHEVLFVGAAGDDASCAIFVEALHTAKVTPRLDIVDAPTGTVVALVARDGQRSMLTDRGANALLDETFVNEQLDEHFDHLHVSGYVLLDPRTRHVGVSALADARAREISTSTDVCSVEPLRAVTREVFLEAAVNAATLFANEEEALVLASAENVESALDTLCISFEEVIITLGARGALGARGTERFHAIASDVRVVDTTGAGDAASGSYLAARLEGRDPPFALSDAMVAAGRVVGGLGALG